MTGITVTQFTRGMSLYSAGQPAQAMYFILSGNIQIIEGTKVSYVSTGAVIGALEFLNGRPYRASARCSDGAKVLVMNDDNIVEIFKRQPQIGYYVLKTIAAEVASRTALNNSDGTAGVTAEDTKAQDNSPDKSGDESNKDGAKQSDSSNKAAVSLSHIMPEGHPVFEDKESGANKSYIFDKEVECPVCRTSFTGVGLRESRLITKTVTRDFRVINEDFEPLWYYIWVCPKCLFAYPHKQFSTVSQSVAAKVRKAQKEAQIEGAFEFSKPRTLQEVFLSYYLALRTYEQTNASPQQLGNLWLRLVWLYDDVNYESGRNQAAEKALNSFEDALVSSWRSEAGDQKMYVIMAELCMRLGRQEEALRYLRQAVNLRQGNERYRRQAADRIQDIRH